MSQPVEAEVPGVPENAPQPENPFLDPKVYDKLKYVALVLLPAVGAAYFAIAQIWGLPAATEVVGTITIVDTFLGVLLRESTKRYNENPAAFDGVVHLEPDHENDLTNVRAVFDENSLAIGKGELRMKVVDKL